MSNNFFDLMTRPVAPTMRHFEDLFGLAEPFLGRGLVSDESAFMPSVDVQENGKSWMLSVDVPGVKKEDLKIDVEGHRLVVSGQRFAEESSKGGSDKEGTRWSHVERRFGSFSRSFTLPDSAEVDAIEAEHSNGVLKIVVPKKSVAARKTISIKAD